MTVGTGSVTTHAPPTITGIDIVEAGRVMAQLNDWRAITFVLIVIIALLLVERMWANREARLERKETMMLAREFAESAGKVANALNALRSEVSASRRSADDLSESLRHSSEG